ncbi:hypothetical protein IWW56_002793 [Coemansia sp. RSA 2131]|nr:hypothetical protein IWW56_002793 [Coemansia sp. RSA 2131]
MMMFSIGSDSNFSLNAPENNLGDGSKPNSLYGGSVRPQHMVEDERAIALQDLSPSRTAIFTGEDASVSDLEFGLGDSSTYTRVGADSEYEGHEEDAYELETPSGAGSPRLAECSVEKSGGGFDGPSVGTIEPGGSGSAAGSASVSRSSSSQMVPQQALSDSLQVQMHPSGIALKSAADLLSEIFPSGVPSQGELKSGVRHIDADVRFRAVGCQRPWHAFIVDDVLYVHVSEFGGSERNFRDAIMALMELAEDVLGCLSVVVALPRAIDTRAGSVLDTDAAATLVRAFMYSGFELVSPMLYCPSPAYILVGYDAM